MTTCSLEVNNETAFSNMDDVLEEEKSLMKGADLAITLAAVHKGEVVHSSAIGSISGRDANVEQTVFMTASISKLMVAVLALQSSEKGLLALDHDISDYVNVLVRNPHFPDEPITVRQLLTHSSSLSDNESAVNTIGQWKTLGVDCPVTLEEYVKSRLLDSNDLWNRQAPPGKAKYHYSNAGFTLLGWVLEKACALPLAQLAQKQIFEELGMTRTKFTLAEMQSLPDTTFAEPHWRGDGHGPYGLAEFPAAGLRSTAADLARFLQAFTRSTNPLLSDASVTEMLPSNFERGLAWWGCDASYGDRRRDVWTHGGFMSGVRTHIYLFPQHRAGAIILTNYEGNYFRIQEAIRASLLELCAVTPN